jgi:large subunit ribosomal protein L14
MIQSGTYLSILDNSGAKKVKCIKILNSGFKQRYSYIGSTVLVSIKSVRFSKNIKVKKGEIHRALIIKAKTAKFLSSRYTKYFENSAVLINKKNKLIGTRIFSMLPQQFKYSRYLKLITISAGISL